MEEDEQLRAYFPSDFGKQDDEVDLEAVYEKTKRKEVAVEPEAAAEQADSPTNGSSDDDYDPLEDYPITHELRFRSHTKPVVSLSVDPSGARFITGSYDTEVKFWDFNGMNPVSLKPFRTIEPVRQQWIRGCAYNASGDKILVFTSDPQAKVLDREGQEIAQCARGDPYLRDLKLTKGHTAEITNAEWHPVESQVFATSSADATVRIWDANKPRSHQSIIILKSAPGQRVKASTFSYSLDGKQMAIAANDGTIQLWANKAPYNRPHASVIGHEKSTDTSSLVFNRDASFLVSRGGDNVVKLWDTRQFKQPLATREGLVSSYLEQNIIFSPDNRYLLLGTDAPASQPGLLYILSSSDLSTTQAMPIGSGSCIRVHWNSKLNQIFTTDATGGVSLLFSPSHSVRGAKLILSKAPKVSHIDDDPSLTTSLDRYGIAGDQANGGAADDIRMKRKARNEIRDDPILSRKPQMPASSVTRDPDLGHIQKTIPLASMRDEDPREALLKYAELAKKDPLFTKAYLKSQPDPQLGSKTSQQISEEQEQREAKRRK